MLPPLAPSLNSIYPAVCYLNVHLHSVATSYLSPLLVGGEEILQVWNLAPNQRMYLEGEG